MKMKNPVLCRLKDLVVFPSAIQPREGDGRRFGETGKQSITSIAHLKQVSIFTLQKLLSFAEPGENWREHFPIFHHKRLANLSKSQDRTKERD